MVLIENKTSKAYTTCTLLELIELKVKENVLLLNANSGSLNVCDEHRVAIDRS
jgi:hypothetical protein